MNSLCTSNMLNYCHDNYLLILGLLGQGFFFGRFFVQWIASEREGKSIVPLAFWYFSIGGGGLLLIYSILRKDPVYILGQGGGLIIYVRNLYLIRTEHSRRKV
ncbi:Lipid A biosynthesis domain protein (fragment) [Syntrophobacter sp. SbD1]